MNKLDLYRPDMNKRPYLLGLLIGLDQLVNALLGGYVDETLSSRAHREGHKTLARWIDRLFWFDRQGEMGHCELSFYGELAREHFPAQRLNPA